MSKLDLSVAIQDYLKEIYKLQASGERATTTAIARRMGVAPSSATSMLKKLAVLGLAEHAPYRGVELSEAGTKIALEVIRHHRLLEQYLAETLGLGIDAVHAEADRLEHVISEELEARMDEQLGFPTHDPHGDPIPDAGLNVDRTRLRSLEALVPGEQATVRRIPDGDADLLRYLAGLTLLPGRRVTMRRSEPFGGPLTVDVDGSEHAISRELAGQIGVSG
ncbi:MAG TPA: metal-dependent transcriptional regulator [Gaiellaceae bacterium]|jgi:DtxR family Mn-dependent transcriptional regulator|nr:metal-dependent transcriptional regulator [Gaiellaceae bacterium]